MTSGTPKEVANQNANNNSSSLGAQTNSTPGKSGTNSQQANVPAYGGDEISAIVLDPGSAWTRAGYSGEDVPKCYVPSKIGVKSSSNKKYYGDSSLNLPLDDLNIISTVNECLVTDFDAASNLWTWCFEDYLRIDIKEHPLIMTEANWNPISNREKTMQVAFESMHIPAFFLVKQAVANSFAHGKPSALVVDVGSDMTHITPVFEGLTLNRGIVKSKLAGSYIDNIFYSYITQLNNPDLLKLRYQISRKSNSVSDLVLKSNIKVTESFHNYQLSKMLHEMKESLCQIHPESILDESLQQISLEKIDPVVFEFPSGIQKPFDVERYLFAESLFNPAAVSKLGLHAPENSEGLAQLIARSVWACDPDLLSVLLNNIVIVGGTTLIPGFCDRLHNELNSLIPGSKIKINASANSVERTCSSWLGSSILSSLGTFHQLWISRSEYEENGSDRAALLAKRCK